MRRDDLEAILSVTNAEGRLAFELAAFTRLRASELRGLRWSDVDLKISMGPRQRVRVEYRLGVRCARRP